MLNILYLVLSEHTVNVELVDSGYRSYTFKFTINTQIHIFTSTYSKLHKLHQLIKKDKQCVIAFDNNIPPFPAHASIIGNKECTKQLLIYFKSIISNPLILKNKLFQNGIKLNQHLKNLTTIIANNKISQWERSFVIYDKMNLKFLNSFISFVQIKCIDMTSF